MCSDSDPSNNVLNATVLRDKSNVYSLGIPAVLTLLISTPQLGYPIGAKSVTFVGPNNCFLINLLFSVLYPPWTTKVRYPFGLSVQSMNPCVQRHVINLGMSVFVRIKSIIIALSA